MGKLNCWEFKKCGREPGGENEIELGTCPAATEKKADQINSGTNGGRSCWAVAGTLAGGDAKGMFAGKIGSCLSCDFFVKVAGEEEFNYQGSKYVREKLG